MGKASSAAATTRTTSRRGATSATAESTTTISESPADFLNMKRKKKKGRPSLQDLQKRQQSKTLTPAPAPAPAPTPTPPPPATIYNSAPARRSTRRNPVNYDSLSSEFVNDDYDDDDERQQKKVKLVVRLPQSSEHHFRDSPSQDSAAYGSDSDAEDAPNPDASPKKRKINAVDRRSNNAVLDQGLKAVKVTDSVHGSPLESGPTTPLPDKTMLVFVLDRLQKKDTYGVFSEPVDPNELPDYHEIIEHPMDFGTVRKKLDGGVYTNLEELEADVMLIGSNAMQYNAPDTIYFRQARSIQELAKRDFENLRNEGDNGEPQPKVVRRGRPPNKNLKKPLEGSPADRVGPELSSGATLASGEDKANVPNGYNLRKGPTLQRLRSNDTCVTSYRPRNGENYSDWLVDWNSEFPASILRADMKYGKKHFSVDENRRDTYKQFQASPSSSKQFCISDGFGDMRQLMAVGLPLDPHAYARSLARYAANLGPVAWNVASRKLKSALPDGLAFGPGWVEENDTPTEPLTFSAEKLKLIMNGLVYRPVNPSSPDLSSAVHRSSGEMVEAGKRLSCPSPNVSANQGGGSSWTTAASSFQLPQKSVFHPSRNGFNGMFGFDLSSQMGSARLAAQAGQSGMEEGSIVNQMLGMQSAADVSSLHPGPLYQASSEETKLSDNWGAPQRGNPLGQASGSRVIASEAGISGRSSPQVLSAQDRQHVAIPPDLNIRVQASGSPSSSLQIGSPQPDLALQL